MAAASKVVGELQEARAELARACERLGGDGAAAARAAVPCSASQEALCAAAKRLREMDEGMLQTLKRRRAQECS